MTQLERIIADPRLLENYIHFAGLTHIRKNQPFYKKADSSFLNENIDSNVRLLQASMVEVFYETLVSMFSPAPQRKNCIRILSVGGDIAVAKFGMLEVVRQSMAYIQSIVDEPAVPTWDMAPYYPSPDAFRCPICQKGRFPLSVEDLETVVFQIHVGVAASDHMYWYCNACSVISSSRIS